MLAERAHPITVAIVEDDPCIRESLMVLINGTPGFRCVGGFANAESALLRLPEVNPEVILMDIFLPKLSGIECVRQLKTRLPSVQIVMLTGFEDDELVFDSLAAGASGYLLKRTAPARILEAIDEVRSGGSPMSSYVARKVVQTFQKAAQPAQPEFSISQREEEILALLAKGRRYKEIADSLAISIDTVRTHVRRIYEKLHVHSRTEAVVKFLSR